MTNVDMNTAGIGGADMSTAENAVQDAVLQHYAWGRVDAEWTCSVIAVPQENGGHDVTVTVKDRTLGREYTSAVVTMYINQGAQTFSIRELPGRTVNDAVMTGKLTQEPGQPVVFETISFDVDPIRLLGVRNIALNDMPAEQSDQHC